MHVIHARNVQSALPEALYKLRRFGVERNSRNGKVSMFPGPVTTLYEHPTERVLFWPERDANPFFHFMEALWMLGGRHDVGFLQQFVPRMAVYSDNGTTFHGAYGYRWRNHFNKDQLPGIILILQQNPESRRCVLQMWDADEDLWYQEGKDLPCNTQAYFTRNEGGDLDLLVTNRSNDIVWGAYGANAVHFSMLQEFMAAAIGCSVGRYWQVSNNFHAYEGPDYDKVKPLADTAADVWSYGRQLPCPYSEGTVIPYPMISTPIEEWLADLDMFLSEGMVIGIRDPFFRRVAWPLWCAHRAYKDPAHTIARRVANAFKALERCEALDWRLAAGEWIQRRAVRHARAAEDGVVYE